jgi:hypothetical protein
MRGMLAPLSPHEESALRKIGFGNGDPLEAEQVRRLVQLELIEWSGWNWRLIAVGQRRYDSLVTSARLPAGQPSLARPARWVAGRGA